MDMKRLFALITALTLAVSSFAQTPEEIVDRMSEAMEQLESNGLRMTMDIKIPILGTMSTVAWSLGDKMRMEAEAMGKKIITWMDNDTEWTYTAEDNTVTIQNRDAKKPSSEQENMKMLDSVTEGYDVFLKKETDTAWYIQCKKNKTNTNKDDPKTMDLVVAKGTYHPVSLSARVSGITVTMRDLGFNVTEKEVTFNKADYPGVTIVDKR
jgi:outer membrane lipoprotein-sorting protein